MPHAAHLSRVPHAVVGFLVAVTGLGPLIASVGAPAYADPVAMTGTITGAPAATPPPVTAYEMPFPCGQTWTGTTHPDHTPSPRALDWNAPGDLGAPVVAAAAGTVVTALAGHRPTSYGRYVVVDHGGGESTLYAHLDSVTVAVGEQVTAAQQLGTLGSTGNSTGPHLHFEERLDGVDQDVWLHGAPYPIGVPAVSSNCGAAAATPLSLVPVSTHRVPLAGNLLGTAAAEVVVYKRGNPGAFVVTRAGRAPRTVLMGHRGDQPVLGDWDGDGRVNVGVRVPGTKRFWMRVHGRDTSVRFGQPHDLPIAGNFDGSGGWEVGVRKAHSGTYRLRGDDGTVTRVVLGDAGDLPVTGDWNGDGTTDLGAYDPTTSVFTLRTTDASGAVTTTQVAFGVPGDEPVAGDWNGDGTTEIGVWDPRTKVFSEDGSADGVTATVAARTSTHG